MKKRLISLLLSLSLLLSFIPSTMVFAADWASVTKTDLTSIRAFARSDTAGSFDLDFENGNIGGVTGTRFDGTRVYQLPTPQLNAIKTATKGTFIMKLQSNELTDMKNVVSVGTDVALDPATDGNSFNIRMQLSGTNNANVRITAAGGDKYSSNAFTNFKNANYHTVVFSVNPTADISNSKKQVIVIDGTDITPLSYGFYWNNFTNLTYASIGGKTGSAKNFAGNIKSITFIPQTLTADEAKAATAPEGTVTVPTVAERPIFYRGDATTSSYFRIPFLMTTTKGTVIAGTDANWGSSGDSAENIDAAFRRKAANSQDPTDAMNGWDNAVVPDAWHLKDFSPVYGYRQESASLIDGMVVQDTLGVGTKDRILMQIDAFAWNGGIVQRMGREIYENGPKASGNATRNVAIGDGFATIGGKKYWLMTDTNTMGNETNVLTYNKINNNTDRSKFNFVADIYGDKNANGNYKIYSLAGTPRAYSATGVDDSNLSLGAISTYELTPNYELKKSGIALLVDQKNQSASTTPPNASAPNGTKVPMNVLYKDSELQVYNTSYIYQFYSDDDGVTWNLDKNITGMVKTESSSYFITGPGRGIQLQKGKYAGRIVFPVYHSKGGERSNAIYSDDGGATWKCGEVAVNAATSEAALVELPDGSIRMFMRTSTNSLGRYYTAVSVDGGATFLAESAGSSGIGEANVNGVSCQLAAFNYSKLVPDKNTGVLYPAIILGSAYDRARVNGRVNIGLIKDNNATYENGAKKYDIDWQYQYVINTTAQKYGYNCITELPDGKIGLLYEDAPDGNWENGLKRMMYQEFTISELIAGAKENTVKARLSTVSHTGGTITVKIAFDKYIKMFGNPILKLNGTAMTASTTPSPDNREYTFTAPLADGATYTITSDTATVLQDIDGGQPTLQLYNTLSNTADVVAPTVANKAITAVADKNQVTLNFAKASDNTSATAAIKYQIYKNRMNVAAADMTTLEHLDIPVVDLVATATDISSYTVTKLKNATQYHFTVVAVDENNNRTIYNTVTATTPINKDELQAAIAKDTQITTDTALYTVKSYNNYKAELAKATPVNANTASTQYAVDFAATMLNKAILNLVKIPSITDTREVTTIPTDKITGETNKFSYTDGFTVSNTEAYKTGTDGAYTIDFVGNTIEIWGTVGGHGIVSIVLDSEPAVEFNMGSATRTLTKIFSKASLTEGPHRVVVTNTGRKGTPGGNVIQVNYAKVTHQYYNVTDFSIGSNINLDKNDTYRLTPTNIVPSYAKFYDLAYTSSDPAIVSVSDDGLVSGLAIGTATITATSSIFKISKSIVVTVVPSDIVMTGTIVDTGSHYGQDKYAELKVLAKKTESLSAWKNDKAISEIAILSKASGLTNLKVVTSDLTSGANTIPKSNVSATFLKETLAYTASPGYHAENRPLPVGNRESVPDILYTKDAVTVPASAVQQVWVEFAIPTNATAGIYTGTLSFSADNALTPMVFTYTVEVMNVTLPTPDNYKFDVEYWQYPYSSAEYYNVEPFSAKHFDILRPHMQKYKSIGANSVTASIVEEAWGGQTYSANTPRYPSMIKWFKEAGGTGVGTYTFDFTAFDKWIAFNDTLGFNGKIVLYSMIPWGNNIKYTDKGDNNTVKTMTLAVNNANYAPVWTQFLRAFVDHLDAMDTANGTTWFDRSFIGIDERPSVDTAFNIIDAVKNKDNKMLKKSLAGSHYDGSFSSTAARIDDLSIGTINLKTPAPANSFKAVAAARKANTTKPQKTTMYTCTEHFPNSEALSLPSESYWSPMFAASLGAEGLMRWAFDAWVVDPLRDTTHWAFEAGDCFLIYPDEKNAATPVSKSSVRLEKLDEGTRDVNKLLFMAEDLPSIKPRVDALLATVKPTYTFRSAHMSSWADETSKVAIPQDMATIKAEIKAITAEYITAKGGVTPAAEPTFTAVNSQFVSNDTPFTVFGTATTTDGGTISYKWYDGDTATGTVIATAESPRFSLPNVGVKKYTVVATNTKGSATQSKTLVITVEAVLKNDVNGDGFVNIQDALMSLKIATNVITGGGTPKQKAAITGIDTGVIDKSKIIILMDKIIE